MSQNETPAGYRAAHDRDEDGDRGTQAYVWYIVGMCALCGFLLLMGYLAWTNGWVPHR